MIGTRVSLRLRMSSRDAHLAGELVDGARILALFGDLATELLIRLDGDEGLFRAYDSVEFLAPVLAGDYIEATAELVRVEATSRQMRFEARKVIANLRDPGLPPSAAEVIANGIVVCRATGTCVTPTSLQRRPKELYMPALPPGPAPGESPLVTPPVTDFAEVVLTAALAVDGVPTQAIVDEALRCREAGAAVIHLHPRSAKDLVGEAIAGIRARTDCLVQTSLGGAPGMSLEERARPLSFHPELATLDCGTVNVGEDVVVNTSGRIRDLAARLKRSGCVAELQCYEVGHLEEALLLTREGNVGRPLHVRLVLGAAGAMQATEENLGYLRSRIPEDVVWGVAGVGGQVPLTELALRMGGHVRVGLDDVARAAAYARSLGRTPVTPARARTILGVTPRNGA